MDIRKINVGRVKSRVVGLAWWMHCPLCPLNPGFDFKRTQEDAWDAAERHLFKRHPNCTDAASWRAEFELRKGVHWDAASAG